jgi:MFS family permease
MYWRILPLMMLFVALAHFNRISMSVAGAEQIIPHRLLSETAMGFVYSAYLFPYTVFMIAGGWFTDRFGPRVAWMVLGFGSVPFIVLTGVAGILWTTPFALLTSLLLIRGLLGVAGAPLHPAGARLVGNWIPPSAATLANGLTVGAACVGIASTYYLFGKLIDAVSWQAAFLVTAAVTLVVALIWSVIATDCPPGVKSSPAKTRVALRHPPRFVELLRHRSLFCLTLSYAALGYFEYLFFYWAQYYFETIQNLGPDTGRRNTSILTLAMGAGMALGGYLTDRVRSALGTRRGLAVVPVTGLVISAFAVVAGLFVPIREVSLAAFTLAMASAGASEGAFWTASVDIGGRRGGTAAGILNTGGNAGGLLAPILTPILSKQLGWKAGFGMASVVSILAAVLWFGVDPSDRLDDEPEDKLPQDPAASPTTIKPDERSFRTGYEH